MGSLYISAQSSLESVPKDELGHPIGMSMSFTCPYRDCQTFAVHRWGAIAGIKVTPALNVISQRPLGTIPTVVFSRCDACHREAIYVGGRLLMPDESDAPPPADDMPSNCIDDYKEAQSVLSKSPRSAAALLRLTLQKLLPHLGATKSDINGAIGELVSQGKIKHQMQKSLDTVRVIGNESVHPGEMNLRDDHETALSLFTIINLIVEMEITEPKRLNALYASLPKSKLDGIANRDSSSATE